MKAYGYMRVSGLGQQNKDGFVRQEKAIRDYAKANGIELVEVFKDVFTGVEENRPELARLMVALEDNGDAIKTVIIEKLDRLARDLFVQEAIVRDLQKNRYSLISATEGTDLLKDDPSRKLFRQMMGAIHEYEKTMLVLKLRAARERKRLKNGKCEGRLFYKQTDPELIVTIKRLSRKPRNKNRLSCSEIAKTLNEMNLSTQLKKPFTKQIVHHIQKTNNIRT